MPNGALSQVTIVDALDNLGGRAKMADVWTKNADEPYPPEAVRKRSKRLRWRLRLKRGTLLVLTLLVGVTGGLGIAGWTIPGVLSGFLFGFGSVFAVTSLFTDPWAEDQVRALQLYDLLQKIDDHSKATSASTH